MKKYQKHINSFSTFQGLGYLLGGILPVAIAIIWTIICGDHEVIKPEFIPAFSVYAICGFIIGVGALFVDKHANSKYQDWFFNLQAIFSFLFIHFLVIYTGGPKSSVFALSYLYLPAIVGYTYGNSIELRGAVIILSVSYISNLFWIDEQYVFFKPVVSFGKINLENQEYTSNNGEFVYLIVFLIQMIVTSIIASKRSLVDNDEVTQ